jgi:ABC-type multidrug transport system ATPase subunit/pSer/pThr/pTyr-binding forkhead associated (FHA) protein
MPAAPLRLFVDGTSHLLTPDTEWLVGRDTAACRVVVIHPLVSGRHLRLRHDGSHWRAADLGSTNGTWHNGTRINEIVVNGDVRLRLAVDGPEIVLSPQVPAQVGSAAPAAPLSPPPLTPPPLTPQPLTPQPPSPPPVPPPPGTVRSPAVPAQGFAGAGIGPAAGGGGGPVLTGVHRVGMRQGGKATIRIGRDPSNDLVITDLLASRRHAEFTTGITGGEIVDLGSANGTYVNGRRITGRVALSEGDIVGIGRHQLRLVGDELLEYEDTGDLTFVASELTVKVPVGRSHQGGEKILLDGVGFTLPPRSMLAVVGPSGAGKSTLLGALTGIRPASSGSVTYAGRDLYAEYDDLRQRIGLVPQEDIWHTALTVRQALEYGAELRFPSDVSEGERNARIDEVLAELELSEQQHNRGSGQLSGGQKKRTSTALELLTKPSLLFLDEPTSGLDPDLDSEVMMKLRDLADDGRTVVVVTHSTLNLHVCDLLLVLAEGGHLAYLGRPEDALTYFGARSYSEMFHTLKGRPPREWAQRFRQTDDYRRHVMGSVTGITSTRRTDLPPLRQQSIGKQFGVLCRRYLSVIAADRAYLGILIALPVILAAISRIVPAPDGLGFASTNANLQARQLLLVIVLGSVLMGAASAVREIVKERPIYQRERSIGLSAQAYLWSKVVVLSVIVTGQAILLTVLGLVGRKGAADPVVLGSTIVEVAVAVVVLTIASAMIGLLISAWVNNADKAMPMLVLMIMVQLVFSGGLVPLAGRPGLQQVSYVVPARWGFAMTASTVNLHAIETIRAPKFCAQLEQAQAQGELPADLVASSDAKEIQDLCHHKPPVSDALWKHSSATWLGDLVALLALSALSILGVSILLRRLEPKRRAGQVGQVLPPVGGTARARSQFG